METTEKMHRAVIFRLHPGSRAKHLALSRTAGACRWVWNQALAHNRDRYERFKSGEGERPSVTFFSMGVWFTKLRRRTDWLQELPHIPVKYTLKYQADAWKAFFAGGGHPRFHGRRGADSFTIPADVRLHGDYLRVPKIGLVRLSRRGGNPYAGGKVIRATVKREAGKWFCVLVYELEKAEPDDNGLAVGVDMNCGQVATSTGEIIRLPNVARLEARKRRYQRMMARRKKGSGRRAVARHRCARVQRKLTKIRKNWAHETSRILAETAGLVVIEDLETKSMTRSAKGDVVNPGKNVKAKSGLNRSILATGWGDLRRKLEYKCAGVEAVQPRYTSQTCRSCGQRDPASRKSQSQFKCVHCGHEGNAGVNAALNILALGTGASGRRGALALATPMNRQIARGADFHETCCARAIAA